MSTATQDRAATFLKRFEQSENDLCKRGPAWLTPRRKAAIARFAEVGFPGPKHEEWRYTNVSPLIETDFVAAPPAIARREQFAPIWFEEQGDVDRVVFVNGRFSADLSSIGTLPEGAFVGSLAEALAKTGDTLEPYLGRLADHRAQPFIAINTAFFSDGLCVFVPRGKRLERPVHAVYFTSVEGDTLDVHPRNLIVAEESAEGTVIESYLGRGNDAYWNNVVTEVSVADNAHVRHYKLQAEQEHAFHLHHFNTHQLRDCTVNAVTMAIGGGLVRNTVNACLDGTGSECNLDGLNMLRNQQHVDDHLRVEHLAAQCNSREFYRNILDDKSHAVFTGRIYVEKDAQQTDGKQTNQNLLLTDTARVDTKPQLEIFADDVKCTHGATIGQLDRDALFYLRSRGISEATARGLMIYAFAGETLDKVLLPGLRGHLLSTMFERLPSGSNLQEMP